VVVFWGILALIVCIIALIFGTSGCDTQDIFDSDEEDEPDADSEDSEGKVVTGATVTEEMVESANEAAIRDAEERAREEAANRAPESSVADYVDVPATVSEAGVSFLFGGEGFRSMPYVGKDTGNITIGYGYAFIGGVQNYDALLTQAERDAINRNIERIAAGQPINNVDLNNDALMSQIRADLHRSYGDIIPSTGQGLTEPEANALARHVISSTYGAAVNTFLERNPEVRVTQHQFDALVSFTYQHGPGYMTNTGDDSPGSTMRSFLTTGDFSQEATMTAFMAYKDTPERRRREAILFSTGQY